MAPGQHHYVIAQARRKRMLALVRSGVPIMKAVKDPQVGVGYRTYAKWRHDMPDFAAEMDVAAGRGEARGKQDDIDRAAFAERYFGMTYAPFQMRFLNEIDNMRPGNIVMALWPPEHGKTSTFENYATETLARNPDFRMTVASEGLRIAQKIVGRIRNRLEPNGPLQKLVRDYGPFKAPTGLGREQSMNQPWSNQQFNVWGKQTQDERDYNMQALGYKSSIVSTRCDHLHLDDMQSLNSLGESERMEEWVRQDALSRPGESGKTSIVGTRVGESDVYERLSDDPELIGIMKVLKFPAIVVNEETGEPEPLWHERYTMEQLERQKRKVGQEAWDRNYMQNPGASRKTRLWDDDIIGPCLNALLSLHHRPQTREIMYLSLDPAIGGQNCVMAVSLGTKKLTVRWIAEKQNLSSNEEIMSEVSAVAYRFQDMYKLTDLVVENMNFQQGLANDERLREMATHYGMAVRGHKTGWNKYDEDIGIPSMVGSFLREEIELPWADDPLTQHEIGELVRQLKAWRPKKHGGTLVARGNKLRQDRVMALWFAWIIWQQRYKEVPDVNDGGGWQRGVPWRGTKSGLIMPIGAFQR